MNKLIVILLAAFSLTFCQCKQEEDTPKVDPPAIPTKTDTILGLINSNVTTLIVVRHAEKAGPPTNPDPDLDSAGQARAQELKSLLTKVTINNVYSTEYKRTQQTVKPLADSKGLTTIVRSATTAYPVLLGEVYTNNKGKVAVIVGHSNTVPDILKQATNNGFTVTIPETQFDNLFVVTKPDSVSGTVKHLKYGVSTP